MLILRDVEEQILKVLGLFLSVPALYTLYSIKRYFTLERMVGGDHFQERLRDQPLLTQGAKLEAWSVSRVKVVKFDFENRTAFIKFSTQVLEYYAYMDNLLANLI